jgi:hypothetical protein
MVLPLDQSLASKPGNTPWMPLSMLCTSGAAGSSSSTPLGRQQTGEEIRNCKDIESQIA